MAIKVRNQELTIKLLNMHASLGKQKTARRSPFDKKYLEIMEQIRDKSGSVREKVAYLKKVGISNRRVVNSSSEKNKKAG